MKCERFGNRLRLIRRERGQTLIEFALIFPLVLLLLVTIVDFGIAFDRRIVLQHAVREGARYAAVHTVESDIKQRTFDQAQGIIEIDDVCVEYEAGTDAGDLVKVSAEFQWDLPFVAPVLSGLFGGTAGTITMTPYGRARLEQSASGGSPCPF